ncbi:MAG: DUF4962 domain-containing protein [Nanoarchaeota archaeon]
MKRERLKSSYLTYFVILGLILLALGIGGYFIKSVLGTGKAINLAPPVPGSNGYIGNESILPEDSEQWWSLYINRAPGNGNVVDLNPPRFRWPHDFAYLDGCQSYDVECQNRIGSFNYTLQIATDGNFQNIVVSVSNINDNNFYSFISPLDTSITRTFFWRIGYLNVFPESNKFGNFNWSEIWNFTITQNAVVWDRSLFSKENLSQISVYSMPHPRMLLSDSFINQTKSAIEADPIKYAYPSQLIQSIIDSATSVVQRPWYINMTSWPEPYVPLGYDGRPGYIPITRGLADVAFAYRWTNDSRYSGINDRVAKLFRYSLGGPFTPENFGSSETDTSSEESIGFLYDWTYPEMNESEREDAKQGIMWRTRAVILYNMWGLRLKYDNGSYISSSYNFIVNYTTS